MNKVKEQGKEFYSDIEIIEIVNSINNNKGCNLYDLLFVSNGDWKGIKFLGEIIWDSENGDGRHRVDEQFINDEWIDVEYTLPLRDYVIEEIKRNVYLLKQLKFK